MRREAELQLTWQRMQTNDNMHAVRGNGIVGDLAQILLLVAAVQIGSWDFYPGRIGHGDSKEVDIDRRKLVDRIVGDEGPIVFLENLTAALLAHGLTEGPLVSDVGTAIDPDIGRVCGLDLEPCACQYQKYDEFMMSSHSMRCTAYQDLSRKP